MLDLSTPALLFPALSLLLLAYTNRFITLANLVRTLHQEYTRDRSGLVIGQIENLQRRIYIIKVMQTYLRSTSLLLCVVCMFLLFLQLVIAAEIVFAVSLLSMMVSLGYSLAELFISVNALNLQLSTLEKGCGE